MTGSIPNSWAGLVRIQNMYLNNNRLIGTIPDYFGDFEDLSDLRLSDNDMFGSIPTDLGLCTKLQRLYLEMNEFVGTVPTQFANLPDLKVLRVYKNNLNGQMPSAICQRNLEFLAADCQAVSCSCCTKCY